MQRESEYFAKQSRTLVSILTSLAWFIGIIMSIGAVFGYVSEALAGAFLVNRYANGIAAFHRARDIVSFSLLAGLVSTAVSAPP